jgi:hypothetical protein
MKRFLTCALLISTISFSGCGAEVSGRTIKEEKTIEYFDFTVNEFVNELSSSYLIDLDLFKTIDDETEKISSYTYMVDNDIDNMMHYQVSYDDTTEKVSHIIFSFNKDFMGDITSAYTYFFYHIGAISEIIDPDIDIDEVYNEISNVNGNEANSVELYENEEMCLIASCNDTQFTASFLPIEAINHTKGDN